MSGFSPDYAGADIRVSPNFGQRLYAALPDMIVLHYTGMKTGRSAESWLCDPASQVSSHYLVHENGRVIQMVRESDRAWHAGKSWWRGVTDINSCSIGIEMVNPGHEFGYRSFPPKQMRGVVALCSDIARRRAVPPERILAHSDIAPGRKIDPGEKFNWRHMAENGLGHFVAPTRIKKGPELGPSDTGDDVQRLQSMLALYGYSIEISSRYDERTSVVVAAFQRHFRPRRIDGIADPSTRDTLQRLLESLPGAFD